MDGLIIKAISGFYYVKSEDGKTYECKARGKFKNNNQSLLVGDKVDFTPDGEKGVVDAVKPRKNTLNRPPVANIDKLFIVSSSVVPSPSTLLIDRMTALCAYKNIDPVIIFNKNDLEDVSGWCQIYRNAGFKTYTVSAKENIGIEELKLELKNSISAFTGNSGVGKSSILNAIFGRKLISTGEISEKLGRGRHTTRHTELYPLEFGGFVADTPGFSSLELDTSDYDLKENLAYYFKDFEEFIGECRFSSCTHTKENGCAVIDAVEQGKINKTRHNTYLELFEEMKDLKPWQAKKGK